jgi:hypothetical protein
MKLTKVVVWSAVILALAWTTALAGDDPKAGMAEEPGQLLRLEVVMTRSQGDAVIARLPYRLLFNEGDPGARVYGGLQLPIVVRHQGSNTVMFKNAGGEVRAKAWGIEEGLFKVELSAELGGVYPSNGDAAAEEAEGAPAAPVLRSFSANPTITLRDGQSMVFFESADPITGETARAEVTLHVVK